MAVDRRLRTCRLAAACVCGVAGVVAGAAGAAENFRITPSITVRETYSDNINLRGSEERRSDFVTEVMPTIDVNINAPRLKLRGSYLLDVLVYARDSDRNATRNSLDANGTLEALDKWMFVDVRGAISQGVVSPFEVRPTAPVSDTNNRTEVRTFRVSPYVRGVIGGRSDYELRYSLTESRTTGDFGGRSRASELRGGVRGEAGTRLEWDADASALTTEDINGVRFHISTARGRLYYLPDPQVRLNVMAGVERNDYQSFNAVTRGIYGAGGEWAPTQRTRFNGRVDHRFFGSGWSYGVSHRTPSFSVSAGDSRDVTSETTRRSSNNAVGFDLLYNALATRIPDPAERAAETQRLLTQGGIPADLNLPVDATTAGVQVDRRQQIAVGLYGVRNSLNVALRRSHRYQIAGAVTDPTGFPTGLVESAATVTASHALTPVSSITAMVTWQRAEAESGSVESSQWDARLLYTTRLGRATTVLVQLRHARFTTDLVSVQPPNLRENAVMASVSVPF